MGDGGAEGSSAIEDRGQVAISFMPDIDGLGSGSLLDSFLSLKILYYCILYSKVHKRTTIYRGCMHMKMYARQVN